MSADDRRICEVCGRQQVDHGLTMLGQVVVAGSYRDDGTFQACIAPCLDAHLMTIAGLTGRCRRLREGYKQILTGIWTAPNSIDTIVHLARLALYTSEEHP